MIFAARKPNPGLDALIAKVRTMPPMTAAEVRGQRISFAFGQMMDCAPDVTKEKVAQWHDEIYGAVNNVKQT